MIRPQEIQSRRDLVYHDLHRIKTKFHRKHLTLDTIEELYLKKVRLKNVFCRSYKEQESDKGIIFELNKRKCLKNKPLCGLKTVEIASVAKLHWFSQLKNLKNLESLTVWIGEENWKATRGFANTEAKVHFLLRCLKRLPKKMNTLKLYIERLSVKDIARVYRIVSSFRELKTFYRRFGFEGEQGYLKQEHKYMNQYLKRMKTLKEVDYDYWRFIKKDWTNGEPLYFPDLNVDQVDFRGMMERREIFTYVTQLNFDVNGETLETFGAGFGEFGEELIDRDGQSKVVRIPSKTKQEISLFYRFELFPNLKSLMMNFDDGYLYPLGTFVVEGFKALRNLEKLSLLINERPQQTNYIFQGLEHLPLLTSFYLAIEDLRKDEWGILREFIGKQKNLRSFSFHILGNDGNFERENSRLKTLFEEGINLDSKLQYLEIASSKFSLDALSAAFFKISWTNQLKHLKLEGVDDPTVSNPTERCKGICDLIMRNKESLVSIELDIHYVVVPETIRTLAAGIGVAKKLKKLRLKVNYVEDFLKDSLEGLFKDRFENWEMNCLSENEKWIGSITNMFSKFVHLETIELGFPILSERNDVIVNQFTRMLGAVFSLRTIIDIYANLPFEVISPKMLENFSNLFRRMQQPQKISFAFYTNDIEDFAAQENFRRLIEEAKALRLQNVKILCS